ncbi:uroporphyrinogen III synthase [Methylococcaceae bacterium HT4]|nr:uroporphyrinogen III synthase [Methylococcaceae bacterium HT4]TXL21105.1 uroporphyrinogen III synthase [Methylococcaceae bacterium HT5]
MMQTGKNILVTRPDHQSKNLCKLIEQQGWHAIRFPVIDIQAKPLSTKDIQRIQNIEQYQKVIFVSVNAVNFALQLINGKIDRLQKLTCIAVGKASYHALSASGLSHVLMPEQGFNSEAILAMPEMQVLSGQSCLIIRGEGGRELLADSLRERGARVDYLEVYKRVLPITDNKIIDAYLLQKTLSAILIYSGDALKNLVKVLVKEDFNKHLLNIPLIVISQRVQIMAKTIGFKNIIIADEASDAAMINALLNGEECG